MIEVLPPLGKYIYDTWRILPVKCYIDNSVCLWTCIRNVNNQPGHSSATTVEVLGNSKREPGRLQNRSKHNGSLQPTSANRPTQIWTHWSCKSRHGYRNKYLVVIQLPPSYKRPPTFQAGGHKNISPIHLVNSSSSQLTPL
jgi:hypothetical protein